MESCLLPRSWFPLLPPFPVSTSLQRSQITFGSRASALARWQSDWIIARLRDAWPGLYCQTRLFITSGDRLLDKSLVEIGGKGVFTEELETALCSSEIDVAVHSLKDLPVEDTPGLTLGAIDERADARDVLISRERWTLDTLPRAARVGTCSLRRTAQLLAIRPDLTIRPVRGNVDTRIRKAMSGEYDAIVLAAAGLLRLGLAEHISEYLPFEIMLPAPGQAALAAQCRADDEATRNLLSKIDHAPTRAAVTAERAFLDSLGGRCSAPVAAYARSHPQSFSVAQDTSPDLRRRSGQVSNLYLTGLVASPNGRRSIRVSGEGDDPIALGQTLAQRALEQGAEELIP